MVYPPLTDPQGTSSGGNSRLEIQKSRSRAELSGRCDQSVDRRERDRFRASKAKDGRRPMVGSESARFEHFPLREVLLDLADATGETSRTLVAMTLVPVKGSPRRLALSRAGTSSAAHIKCW